MSIQDLENEHKAAAERLLQRIHANSLYGLHPERTIERIQSSIERMMTAYPRWMYSQEQVNRISGKRILIAGRFIIRRDPETGKRYWEPLMHNPSHRCTKGQGEAVPVEDYKRITKWLRGVYDRMRTEREELL